MKRTIPFLLSLLLFTVIASAQTPAPTPTMGGMSSDGAPIPRTVTATGKVFRKDGEKIVPVAGATIEVGGCDTEKAVSGENGKFTLTPSTPSYFFLPLLVRTDDFSLTGIGKLTSEDEPVEIELVPAASLKARLIDPDTGKPLADREIGYLWDKSMILSPYAIATDAEGRFFAQGLMPGKEYFFVSLPSEPSENFRPQRIGMFLALDPGEVDAGDITVVNIMHDQYEDEVLKVFRYEESPTARFEKAILQSKESKKPVLVLFMHANGIDDNIL